AAAGAAGCAGGRSARVGCGRLGGSAAAVLEVGGIPATALELEAGCRDLLDVACRTASGAGGQWRITHLLDVFLLSATGSTAIFVDRHGNLRSQAGNFNRTSSLQWRRSWPISSVYMLPSHTRTMSSPQN